MDKNTRFFRGIRGFLLGGAALACATSALATTSWADGDNGTSGELVCETDRVFDTTIVYVHDRPWESPDNIFILMDDARNTLDRREAAYEFFSDRFGLDFDPENPAPQFTSSFDAILQPSKLNPAIRYQVIGMDVQGAHPKWRHRLPVTNLDLEDDGYIIFVLQDMTVHGTYGGVEGRTIPAGTLLLHGEYRLTNRAGEVLANIHYESNMPMLTTQDGYGTIACDVSNPDWGDGVVMGLSTLQDGYLSTRNVMTFSRRLGDQDPDALRKCENVKSLNDND